ILLRHRAKKILLMAGEFSEPRDVIKRIDETEVWKFRVLAGDRRERRLDVQIRHIIRQDRHLVGVQLLLVFVPEFERLATKMLQKLATEGAGARRRIEDLDAFVDQAFAKMFFAKPV